MRITCSVIGSVSCPICDPIREELKGLINDRAAYWRHFCKVDIITSYHYIIDGDTYKGHTNATWIHQYIATIIQKSGIQLQMKTNKHHSHIMIITLPEPENVFVVSVSHEDSTIPLPWVSRLAKLIGYGKDKWWGCNSTKYCMVATLE